MVLMLPRVRSPGDADGSRQAPPLSGEVLLFPLKALAAGFEAGH